MNTNKIGSSLLDRGRRGALILGLGVLVGAGGYGSFVAVQQSLAESPPAVQGPTPAPATNGGDASADLLSTRFADLAAQVTPAVVQIEVRESGKQPVETREEPPIPEEFRRFFRFPGEGDLRQRPTPPVYGGGTGFIVSPDGYIVTNNHVAGDADQITVTLNDRRTFKAELVGADPTTDVAVIKIDADHLPVLRWGNSTDLRVGEWVLAVGNPGFSGADQLDYTVTAGIVSAKNRPLRLIGQSLAQDPAYGQDLAGYAIENFIQTDAVINPGNSGGPMVNLAGEVVGVNSAIASTDGRFQGYGFAIPSDLVHRVADDLIEHGHVLRPWLGVSVMSVSEEDAEVYGLPRVQGVLIQSVTEDSPADHAGLKQGDVIYAVGDRPMMSGGALQEVIAERHQGDRVTLKIYRDRSPRDVSVKLGKAPIDSEGPAHAKNAPRHAMERLGLELGDLTPDKAAQLGFDRDHGALIVSVEPMGPVARRGVGPGVVIVEVNGTEVDNARAAIKALEDVPSNSIVTLRIVDAAGRTRIVNVRAR